MLVLVLGCPISSQAAPTNELIGSSVDANYYLYAFELMNWDSTEHDTTHMDAIEAMLALKGESKEAAVAPFIAELASVKDEDKSFISYALNKGYVEKAIVNKVYEAITADEAASYLLKGLNLSGTTYSNSMNSLQTLGITVQPTTGILPIINFKNAVVQAIFITHPQTKKPHVLTMIEKGNYPLEPYSYSDLRPILKLHQKYLVPHDELVTITNEPLKAAILQSIEWNIGIALSDQDPIKKSDLFFINEIIINEGLVDFKGIEHLPNLKKLSVNSHTVSLAGLENATTLEEAYIPLQPRAHTKKGATISLAPLQHLTQLEKLGLPGKRLRGESLSKEEKKYVYPIITDFSPLINLTELKELQLSQLGLKSLQHLEKMTQLYSLEVSHNEITDISAVKNMPKLISLDINYNTVDSLVPINACKELLDLSANSCGITSIHMLNQLENLCYLNLKGNKLTDISIIEKMPALKEINIDRNPITQEKLQPYYDLVKGRSFGNKEFLKTTYTFHSPIIEKAVRSYYNKPTGDITYENLYSIESLSLNNKNLSDITDLRNMRKIKYLDLRNNNITNFKPLAELKTLGYLYLDGNQSSDYGDLIGIYGYLFEKDFQVSYKKSTVANTITSDVAVHTVADLDTIMALSFEQMGQNIQFNIINPTLRDEDYIRARASIFKKDYAMLTEIIDLSLSHNYMTQKTKTTTPTTAIYPLDDVNQLHWNLIHKIRTLPADHAVNLKNWIATTNELPYTHLRPELKSEIHPDIKKLALKVTRGKSSSYDKVKAINEWVSHNITYDTVSLEYYEKKQYDKMASQQPIDVLQTKKGICAGFAALTNSMLQAVGVKSYVISGYRYGGGHTSTRQPDYIRTRTLSFNPDRLGGHAWNIAWVDDRWLEFDPTWNASRINFDASIAIKEDRGDYFDNVVNTRHDHAYLTNLTRDLKALNKLLIPLSQEDDKKIGQLLGKKMVFAKHMINPNSTFDIITSKNKEYAKSYGFVKEGALHAIVTVFDESGGTAYLLKRNDEGNWIILGEQQSPKNLFLPDIEIFIANMLIKGLKN